MPTSTEGMMAVFCSSIEATMMSRSVRKKKEGKEGKCKDKNEKKKKKKFYEISSNARVCVLTSVSHSYVFLLSFFLLLLLTFLLALNISYSQR